MFKSLQGEIKGILDGVIELCYFMRGAVTYEEMMRRTPGERQMMNDFIERRLDSEGKRDNPNY